MTYQEFYNAYAGDKHHAWKEYMTYGGMPFLLSTSTPEEKRQQEVHSLKRVPDSFQKIVVVKDDIMPWYDEDGIYYVGIEQFLLDETCIHL